MIRQKPVDVVGWSLWLHKALVVMPLQYLNMVAGPPGAALPDDRKAAQTVSENVQFFSGAMHGNIQL